MSLSRRPSSPCCSPSRSRHTSVSGHSTRTGWAPCGVEMEVAPLTVAIPLLAAGGLTAVSNRVNRAGAEVVALSAALSVTTLCAILLARTGSGLEIYWFVFFELMSIAAFALAGFKVEEEEAVEGSLNFAVTNTIGSFLLLTGIALVYGRTGALNLAQIGEGPAASGGGGLVVGAVAICAAGLLGKAGVVPLHL